MEIGQADGVQCRTVEVFESFGMSEELLREAYHVLEVAFWVSNGLGGLVRKSRTADTAPGLSHQPHVILNQARINQLLAQDMRRSNGQEVDYEYTVKAVEVDSVSATDLQAYPVTVTAEKHGVEAVFKAKYALVSRSLTSKLGPDILGMRWRAQCSSKIPWLQDDWRQSRCRLGCNGRLSAN